MATVHVTLSRVKGRASTGSTMPVRDSVELFADTMTSSATSAQSAITAPDLDCFWNVTVTGGNVWVKFGPNPTAGSGAGHLLLGGSYPDFSPITVGEKIAIKDA